jgi:hypothetical protein
LNVFKGSPNYIGTCKITDFTYSKSDGYWKSKQLLLLSDDVIQEGDICDDYCDVGEEPYNHVVGKCLSIDRRDGWIEFEGYKTGISWCKKVIASYPHIEGTLSLSEETVREWINAGCPKEVFREGEIQYFAGDLDELAENDDLRMDDSKFIYFNLVDGNLLLEFSRTKLVEVNKLISNKELLEKAKAFARDNDNKALSHAHGLHLGYLSGWEECKKYYNIKD